MLKIYIDGASRGNPGKASYAYIIKKRNKVLIEKCDYIGFTTNNVAEYMAFIKALEYIAINFNEEKEVVVYSDSELVVKQLNGLYKVKSPEIRALYDKVMKYSKNFTRFSVIYIPRERNKKADQLCNLSLDKNLDSNNNDHGGVNFGRSKKIY